MSENMKMSPRERVIAALRHKETDPCPYYIWIDSDIEKQLVQHYGFNIRQNYLCDHIAWREIIYGEKRYLSKDTFIDSFGSVWTQGEKILHLVKPALDQPELKGYKMPDIDIEDYFDDFAEWSEDNNTKFKIIQLGMFFFERAWAMRGFENFLVDFYENPKFIEKLFDGLEEVCNGLIDKLLEHFSDRIDAIGFSDDYGAQNNMIISPLMWRKFIKPHLKRMYERIKKGNKYVYLHSCGHVTPIVPDLIELGVDILQPIQPEAMDIFNLKHRFGRDICFAGGISTQQTLPFGTVADVVREVDACLNYMSKDGGYIMAPAKAIMPGVPIENVIALIDAFANQRKT